MRVIRHSSLPSLGLAWCQARLHGTRVDETNFQPGALLGQLGARYPELPSDVAMCQAAAEAGRGAPGRAPSLGWGRSSRQWLSWALKTERLGEGKGARCNHPHAMVPAQGVTRRGTAQAPPSVPGGSSVGSVPVTSGAISVSRVPWRPALSPGHSLASVCLAEKPAFSSKFGRTARPAAGSRDLRVSAEPAHGALAPRH